MSVLKNPSVLLFSHPSWALKDNSSIAGRVQAPGGDRAELLPRPGEARQAAQFAAQGAETQGDVKNIIMSEVYTVYITMSKVIHVLKVGHYVGTLPLLWGASCLIEIMKWRSRGNLKWVTVTSKRLRNCPQYLAKPCKTLLSCVSYFEHYALF